MQADLPGRLDPTCYEALLGGLARAKREAAAAVEEVVLPPDAVTRVLPRTAESSDSDVAVEVGAAMDAVGQGR
jgi:hypothetical protein